MIDFPIVTYKDIKERYGATIAAHLFAMKGLKIVKLGRTVAARKDSNLRPSAPEACPKPDSPTCPT